MALGRTRESEGESNRGGKKEEIYEKLCLATCSCSHFLFILFVPAPAEEKKKIAEGGGDRVEVWRNEFVANRAGLWEFSWELSDMC